MDLIFGRDNAEKLRERYTIMELETIEKDGVSLDVFCVIPAEKIALGEIAGIEHTTKLHNDFVDAIKRKDAKLINGLSVHLMGKFGGELDSFYEEIVKRFNQ